MIPEAYDVFLKRRSCRRFDSARQIDEDTLNAILKAGSYAPSGNNRQSAIIVAVQDEKAKEWLRKMNRKYGRPGGDPFYGAPTILIVLSDRENPNHIYDGALVKPDERRLRPGRGFHLDQPGPPDL